MKYIWCRSGFHRLVVHIYIDAADTAVCGQSVEIRHGEEPGSIRCPECLGWLREQSETGVDKPELASRPLLNDEGAVITDDQRSVRVRRTDS